MIDTLVISRELRKKGFNEVQAEALAAAIHQRQENLATKDDITHLEDKIDTVEQVLGERINSVEQVLGERINSVEKVLGDRIKHVEQVLGDRINSVEKTLGSRVTGLYWFIGIIMGIIGSAVVGQFVLALFS